eukprot:m.6091 g.6091  ORF g.6091 m.6091 type:complete len:91 (-) comp3483_c0_seq1:135-407(-)
MQIRIHVPSGAESFLLGSFFFSLALSFYILSATILSVILTLGYKCQEFVLYKSFLKSFKSTTRSGKGVNDVAPLKLLLKHYYKSPNFVKV